MLRRSLLKLLRGLITFIKTARAYAIRYWGVNAPQLHVSFLPESRESGWPDDPWEKRAVATYGAAAKDGKYHMFFKNSKVGRHPNQCVCGLVCGDIFIFEVSDTEDQSGRNFHEDLNLAEMSEEEST